MSGLLPLCVDLDGTLHRGDVFVEQLVSRAVRLRALPGLLLRLARGRAAFKRRLAELEEFPIGALPFRADLIAWLRGERERGRTLVLVTAADALVAERVAAELGLFDEVLASDGITNLKGPRKAQRLIDRFGHRGFVYAGDSLADVPVWQAAGAAVLVAASPRLQRRVERLIPIEARFEDDGPSTLRSLLRAVRPRQWVKNILVFVPLLVARAYLDQTGWLNSAAAFLSLCALASSVYLLNDLTDLQADRVHPEKRLRPLAAGNLSVPIALVASAALAAIGLGLAVVATALAPAAVYLGVTLLYSAFLKRLQLVDLFTLAGLYTIRVVVGGVASGHPVSSWLLGFCGFLFLALAVMKRVAELRARLKDREGVNRRRAYTAEDLEFLGILGVTSSMASSIVLALFVQGHASLTPVADPSILLAVVPVILLWQARLWLATWRGFMNEDPILYALRDWVTWLLGVLTGLLFFASGIGSG